MKKYNKTKKNYKKNYKKYNTKKIYKKHNTKKLNKTRIKKKIKKTKKYRKKVGGNENNLGVEEAKEGKEQQESEEFIQDKINNILININKLDKKYRKIQKTGDKLSTIVINKYYIGKNKELDENNVFSLLELQLLMKKELQDLTEDIMKTAEEWDIIGEEDVITGRHGEVVDVVDKPEQTFICERQNLCDIMLDPRTNTLSNTALDIWILENKSIKNTTYYKQVLECFDKYKKMNDDRCPPKKSTGWGWFSGLF